jgi:MFS family permease
MIDLYINKNTSIIKSRFIGGNLMNFKDRLAKIIRVITIAPIMAFVILTIVYVAYTHLFNGLANYILAVIFLTVFPVLAYPLQPYIKKFKDKGREGQRNLAIITGVSGYLLGILCAIILNAPKAVWLIYLTYFISGVGIALFNKVLKIRASGHACGVVGPMALLVLLVGKKALVGIILLVSVYWASLRMKRHTVSQLVWGSLIPLVAMAAAMACTGYFSAI